MRKKILTGIAIAIPILLIAIVIFMRSIVSPTNEEIIKGLRDESCYKTKIDFTFINSRGEEIENTTMYYDINKYGKIVFSQDREKMYKDNKIVVKDNIANTEYTLDETLDDLYSLAFLNKLLSFPINTDSIKEGQEEWGEQKYIYFTVEIFGAGNHVNTAKVYIDKDKQVPIGVVVYNKEGKATVKMIYKDFEKLDNLDEDLL